MLLTYRDAQFWKNFRDQHWKPQVPTVLRQPLTTPLFSEDLLLNALKSFEAGLQAGDLRKTCLVSVGDKETAPRRPLRALFREPSGSLLELEAAAARVFPKKNFGLMVTQMQAVDPALWGALTAFIHDASTWLDIPAPRAFLDLFYGNYRSNFTGLHKDTQDIIAFVVRGKKRMLAWPFEYFLKRADGVKPADRYFNKRLTLDHTKFRQDAIVLDAEPGDVFYWPSHYWHVSEVQDGQTSAMLSLGLYRPEIRLGNTSPSTHLVSQDVTAIATADDPGAQLRWRTSFGFELGGPLHDLVTPKRVAASAVVTVVKTPNSVLQWKLGLPGKRLLVAANGHSITLPQSPKLVALLEKLASGEAVSVANTPSKTPVKVAETNWNLQLQLKTRSRTVGQTPGALLVNWLTRVNAVSTAIDA